MFVFKIADTVIKVNNHYEYVEKQCKEYFTDELPDIEIMLTLDEIEKERQGDLRYSLGYCESLAVYRKISQKLIERNIFLIHGAFFSYKNAGILFIGPSGSGKTTQLNKLKSEYNQEINIINGDKPLFEYHDNEFTGFGTPWAGKENKQSNTYAVLKKIYYIEQSNKNYIKKLSNKESIDILLSQVYFPNYKAGNFKLIEIISELIKEIPIYKFYGSLYENIDISVLTQGGVI